MRDLGIGLIGAGGVAREHALAFKNVTLTFGPQPAVPRLAAVFDDIHERGAGIASDFSISRQARDWMDIVRDPAIQLVDIAVTDSRQADIAKAAMAHGKHVLCEHSHTMPSSAARAVADVADAAGVRAGVCFPYLRNPVQTLARKLIATGKLGKITGFRATFDRDAGADGGSARALASHIVALALHLVGPIERVSGMSKVFSANRAKDTAGNADFIQFLCEFEGGAVAQFSAGRMSTGRKVGLTYEAQGPLAAICFNQERMNELDLFVQGDPLEVRGYKTVYSGPDQPDYAAFHPLPGVGLSFNDQRTFDARAMVIAICEGRQPDYDFRFAGQVADVQQAVDRSIEARGWAGLREVA